MNSHFRLASASLVVAFGMFLAGCSGGGTTPNAPRDTSSSTRASTDMLRHALTASTTAAPPGSLGTIIYSAIGDSVSAGTGSTAPCQAGTFVVPPLCAGGTGYVNQFAKLLVDDGYAVTIDDQAIGGRNISTMLSEVVPQPATGTTPATAGIDPASTLVTIFAAGNELKTVVNEYNAAKASRAAQLNVAVTAVSLDDQLSMESAAAQLGIAHYWTALLALYEAVHARAPNATIVSGNYWNMNEMSGQGLADSVIQKLYFDYSTGVDSAIYAKNLALQQNEKIAIPVADLLCATGLYSFVSWSSNEHPDNAGHAIIAQAFYAAYTSFRASGTVTTPDSNCWVATHHVPAVFPTSSP